MVKSGQLYIVATPIGNLLDITLRAIEVLQSADGVICEEYRWGSTLLKKLGIKPKQLIPFNEHNEDSQSAQILQRLSSGESFALISDCGTPTFADPGHILIDLAVISGIKVTPIPGPSSLTSALSILDFKMETFYFRGFLPRNVDERRKELTKLRNMNEPIIIMDTPYRLKPLLEDVVKVFGKHRRITLACDLTLPTEKIFRGNAQDVLNSLHRNKAEFILFIQP
jgi:16S rRNA (cytidine1402-2'-O)-methyltransferase